MGSVSHPRPVPPRSCPRGLAGRSGGAHHCPVPLPQNQGDAPRTQDNLPKKQIPVTEVTTESLLCPRAHGDPHTGPSPALQPGALPRPSLPGSPAPPTDPLLLDLPRALAPPHRGHCSAPPRDDPEAFLVPHGPLSEQETRGSWPWGSMGVQDPLFPLTPVPLPWWVTQQRPQASPALGLAGTLGYGGQGPQRQEHRVQTWGDTGDPPPGKEGSFRPLPSHWASPGL